MNTALSLLLVILSLVGIADAGYITYEKYAGIVPPCGAGFDCGAVLNSRWASIGPVPVSVLGLLFYATVLTLASLHFLELEIFSQKQKDVALKSSASIKTYAHLSPIHLLACITIIGLIFSFFLLFLMAVVIKAWCLYCLISAATSILLFICVQLILKIQQIEMAGFRFWISSVLAFKYRHVLKPLFFLIDAETIHNFMLKVGEWLGSSSVGKQIVKFSFGYTSPTLQKTVDGIGFPSPVGLAAGFDYNGQLTQVTPSLGFGFHTIGTVTLQPNAGNPGVRLDRLPKSKGLLVNKGLKSLGAMQVVKKLEKLQLHIPTGISIASTNKSYASLREQLLDIVQSFIIFEKSTAQHSYYEMNISCPNTFGGEPFTTPDRLEILLIILDLLKISKPLYIKMPIDQSEKETLLLLKIIESHTVAGLIFGNLTKDKKNASIDKSELQKWSTQPGNVSGKPTWERSNRLLALVKKHYKNRFTLIGTGGIFSPQDLAKKQELGADLSQLITGLIFQGPQLIGQINAWLVLKEKLR
jgi:dihydroorotate dehydrogenase